MFKLVNIFNDSMLEYTFKDKKIEFMVEAIINRRLRDEIIPDKIFIILNEYLNYKGDAFKDTLYETLVDSKNIILLQASRHDLEPLPFKMIHQVLDLFDFEDVRDFIKRSGIIHPPSKLPVEFNELIEINEKGSREQTYLQQDYIDLIALITILKATIGPIGEYATIKESILGNNEYKEQILLTFYMTHPIFNVPPFRKIYMSVEKLILRLFNDQENTAVRLIESTVNKDILPIRITSLIVMQKLLLNSELLDTDAKNTITKIYSFASNKLKLKDSTSTIRIKRFKTSDDDSMEAESILESYRTPSDLTIGFIEEFKFVFSDPVRLARWIGVEASDEEIMAIVTKFELLAEPLPIEESLYIVSWIYKDVTDIRSFSYLDITEIIVALGVGFLYLWENGFRDIALIISSFNSRTDNFKLNFSLRNKLDNDIRNKLNELFPYNKAVISAGVVKESSFIEEAISVLSKKIMGYNLVTIIPEQYLKEEFGNTLREVKVNIDIKNRLAELVININDK